MPTFDLYMKMKNRERREMELRSGKHGAEGPAFKNMKRTLFSKVLANLPYDSVRKAAREMLRTGGYQGASITTP